MKSCSIHIYCNVCNELRMYNICVYIIAPQRHIYTCLHIRTQNYYFSQTHFIWFDTFLKACWSITHLIIYALTS